MLAQVLTGEENRGDVRGSACRPAKSPIWMAVLQPDLEARELGYFRGCTEAQAPWQGARVLLDPDTAWDIDSGL